MECVTQLGIQQPIFLAPMAGVSTPTLAAAVSNMGGLGALGLGAASSIEEIRQAILATQKLTPFPFQVNFFCHKAVPYDAIQAKQWIAYLAPHFAEFNAEVPQTLNKIYPSFCENDAILSVLLETKPKAVSFHFGLPRVEQLRALQQAGIITMLSVTQLSEAVAAYQAGIDIIIAQGIEAGGHRASFNPLCDAALSTLELVILLRQYLEIPIVAAGGIMTGADIRMYLELGASAAQLGTAFVQCAESAASEAYRAALFEQPITQISDSISGRPARGLFNAWHQLIDIPEKPLTAGYPYSYDLAKQLNIAASKQGEHGFSAFWAGNNVANIRRLDAQALMRSLIDELH